MKKIILLILIILVLGGCSLKLGNEINNVSAIALSKKYNQSPAIKQKYNLEGVSLKNNKILNSELDKYKNEPKDEIQVRIGNEVPVGDLDADMEFEPSIELKRWNEVSFKLTPTGKMLGLDDNPSDKKLSFKGDKIFYENATAKYEIYDYTENEGGYKYIWYLKEKPISNKIEFQIESSGLNFFYQPPLTEKYQSGWSDEFQKEIVVSETQVKDLEGRILIQATENAVGSYAAFHSTKGGLNDIYGKDYKTGQAFMIYPSILTDAMGETSKAILRIENGIFSEEIPQDFLDKAIYPIKGNATFGNTTNGTYQESIENAIYALVATGASGTGTSITVYLSGTAPSINYKMNVYNGNSPITNGATNQGTYDGTAGWFTQNFVSAPTFSAISYRLAAFGADAAGTLYLNYTDTTANYSAAGATYPTWTDPITWSDYTNHNYSIYVTYTPTAEAAYCGHTGGDWYVNTECWISANTTTQGSVYIGAGGSLNCIDGVVISAKSRSIGNGGSYSVGDGCSWNLWNP